MPILYVADVGDFEDVEMDLGFTSDIDLLPKLAGSMESKILEAHKSIRYGKAAPTYSMDGTYQVLTVASPALSTTEVSRYLLATHTSDSRCVEHPRKDNSCY